MRKGVPHRPSACPNVPELVGLNDSQVQACPTPLPDSEALSYTLGATRVDLGVGRCSLHGHIQMALAGLGQAMFWAERTKTAF